MVQAVPPIYRDLTPFVRMSRAKTQNKESDRFKNANYEMIFGCLKNQEKISKICKILIAAISDILKEL